MKQITAKNPKTTAVYRFVGRKIYLKCNNIQYATQLMAQIKARGGFVKQGRNWIEADIFGDNTIAKIEGNEIDLEKTSEDEIQTMLVNFFLKMLEKAKFETKLEEV